MKKYSDKLKQNYTVNESAKTITTEDGQVYKNRELKLLTGQSPEMLQGVHKFKKIFNGEVVGEKSVIKKWNIGITNGR